MEKTLQKIGVLGIMIDKYELLEQASEKSIAGRVVSSDVNTAIINKTIKKVVVNKQVTEQISYYWAEFDSNIPLATNDNSDDINVKEVTSHYQVSNKMHLHKLTPLSHQATLAEAYLALVENRCGGVYIYQKNITDIIGIVTFEQIRHYLVTGKLTNTIEGKSN